MANKWMNATFAALSVGNVAGLSDASATPPPSPPAFTGLQVIIDPYDKTSICGTSGSFVTNGRSSNWLSTLTCNGTVNAIPGLIHDGAISGIFLHANWSNFAADSGYTQLDAVISSINAIAPVDGNLNITIGLNAGEVGTNTPCSETGTTGVGGTTETGYILIPNQVGENGTFACTALPAVWNSADSATYAMDYADAVVNFYKEVSAKLTVGAVTAVKLAGINTTSQELILVGNPTSYPGVSSPGSICSIAVTQSVCGLITITNNGTTTYTDAADEELADGYSPPAVETVWNSIVGSLISALPTLEYEVDVTDGNEFPPITASVTPSGGTPSFTCGGTTGVSCILDTGTKVGPYKNETAFGYDGHAFIQQLLGDVVAQFNSITPPLPAARLAVQTDGMIDTLSGTINPQDVAKTPLTLPCWAYKALTSQMGFQSVGASMYPFTQSQYEAGLSNAVSYGASYEELYPAEVQTYVGFPSNSGTHGEAFLETIQTDLESSNPSTSTCATNGRTY